MSVAVIIGGSGALGRAFISHFNSLNYSTVSVDLFPNSEASVNCSPSASIADIEASIAGLAGQVKLIVNAAGGWAGGSASDPEFADKCKKMWEMNVDSSILAAQLASKHLSSDELLVLVGAKAVATHTTPEMLAYAMAKSAVASLAANFEVLDTPANRNSMPNSDFSKWTPVSIIAEKVSEFQGLSKEKVNGLGWLITTRSGETKFIERDLKQAYF